MPTIQQISQEILTLSETPHTALKAIHLMIQHGGASQAAWQAVYQRVLDDGDVDGAYYLATFAQNHELPFDVVPLIGLVLTQGNQELRLALLDKLPKEAIAHLQTIMDLDFYTFCKA